MTDLILTSAQRTAIVAMVIGLALLAALTVSTTVAAGSNGGTAFAHQAPGDGGGPGTGAGPGGCGRSPRWCS